MDPVVSGLAGSALVLGLGCAWSWSTKRAEQRARQTAEASLAAVTAELTELRIEKTRFEERAGRAAELEQKLVDAQDIATDLATRNAELETVLTKEREATAEKLQLLEQARAGLTNQFSALSRQALGQNNEEFLKLAKESFAKLQEGARGDLDKRQEAISGLLRPMNEKLSQFDQKVGQVEAARREAYGALKTQLGGLMEAHKSLSQETRSLSTALQRSAGDAGRWGEMQLRRVVELAGMLEHCDFTEQAHQRQDEKVLRPDMVIHLPGGQNIVVDAKAPTSAYLAAMAEEEDLHRREALLRDYVSNLRSIMTGLARKSYWKQVGSPEFVVLFLPAESFYATALERDSALIEDGFKDGVVLATPSTLLTLLKAAAYGWRQEALTENAKEVGAIGAELYGRLSVLAENFSRIGRSLTGTVESYNKAIGSLEGSVLPSARKLKQAGVEVSEKTPTDPVPVEKTVRDLSRPELVLPLTR